MDISDRAVSAETVAIELEMALIAPDDVMVPLIASFYYTSRDPYAVRVAFHVGADEPNEWIFSRDLLAQGLTTCAGLGDVQIWPSSEDARGAQGPSGAETAECGIINLQLSSPTGSARFQVPDAGITAFLAATYQLIELGEETREIDIEAELTDLLREA